MTIKSGASILFLLSLMFIGCGMDTERNPMLNIIPGKYKITVVRNNFDDRGPQTIVEEKCIAVEEYQPFRDNYVSELCKVSNFERIGQSVKYDIVCNKDVATGMESSVAYSYMNDRLKWSTTATGTNGGRIYSFEVNGEALLIGECEEQEKKINVF
jgi:uncharacterized protein DUF3617